MGFDRADHQVFALTHAVSGDTLKHLIAAVAIAILVYMLRSRPGVEQAPVHPPVGALL